MSGLAQPIKRKLEKIYHTENMTECKELLEEFNKFGHEAGVSIWDLLEQIQICIEEIENC